MLDKRFIFIILWCILHTFQSFAQAGYYEGLKAEKQEGKWGFKNTKGKWEINPQYDSVYHHFEFGKAIVGRNQLAAVIDKKGKYIIPYFYTRILPEYKHLFPVRNFTGQWGFIHNNGSQVFPTEYDNFRYEYKDKHLLLQKNGRWGIYTPNTQEIVKPTYKQLHHQEQKTYRALPFTSFEVLTINNQVLYTAEADAIEPLHGNIFSYSILGKKGFANPSQLLSFAIYEDIKPAFDSTYFVKKNGLWGIIDIKGHYIQDYTWSFIEKTGLYFIASNTENEKQIYTSQYKPISTIAYKEVRNSGNALWLVKNNFNLWGCIDSTGEQKIAYRYDSIGLFKNNYAEAVLQGKKLLINTEGDILVNENEYPLYLSGILTINESGKKIGIRGYENYIDVSPLSENYFRVQLKNKLYGVIDKDGLLILSCVYNRIKLSTDETTFIVKQANRISCYSTSGKLVSGPHKRFEDVLDVCENYLQIKYKGGIGFCDYEGQIWVSTQYPETGLFKNGICAVKLRGKWGYIDKEEHLLLQPYYDSPADFKYNAGIIKEKENYYVMNSKGKISIEYPLQSVSRTNTGFYILQNNAGLYGLSNTFGKEVIPSKYKSIIPCKNELYLVSNEYHSGVIDQTGRIIIPIKYNTLQYNSELNVFCGGIEKDWISLKVK